MDARTYDNVIVLAPSGRIDHVTADAFQDDLMPYVERSTDNGHRIVLDLGAVEYMSSAGLRVLMLAGKQSKQQNTTLVVADMQPAMREIFEISRFNLVFDTFDDVRAALAALSPKALNAYDEAESSQTRT